MTTLYQVPGTTHNLRADEIDHIGNPWHFGGSTYGTEDVVRMTTATTATTNRAQFRLYRMARSGYLRNLQVFVDTTDVSNHIELGVWDTGDAVASSYNNLFVATGVTVAASGAWQTGCDPGIAVTQGQHVMFHVASDAGTLKFGSMVNLDNSGQSLLPQGTASGGNRLKPVAQKTSVYGSTTAIVEANMAVSVIVPVFIYQILNNPS